MTAKMAAHDDVVVVVVVAEPVMLHMCSTVLAGRCAQVINQYKLRWNGRTK